jgi:hypothetical protein
LPIFISPQYLEVQELTKPSPKKKQVNQKCNTLTELFTHLCGELINKSMQLQTELLALPQTAEQKGVCLVIYLYLDNNWLK